MSSSSCSIWRRALRASGSRAVAVLRAPLAERAEKSHGRLSRRERVIGEAIADVLHGEDQAQGQLAGIGHGGRAIGEEPLHLGRGSEKSLAVAREQPARLGDGSPVPYAGQGVQQWPLGALGHEGSIAGEERELPMPRFRAQPFVLGLALPAEIALELGEDVEAAEEAGEPVESGSGGLVAVAFEAMRHGPLRAARQAHEATHVLLEIVPARRAFALGRAHLDPGQEATEISIALAILDEEGQPAPVPHADLRADERRDAEARAGTVEARRAVDAVGVHESERALPESGRALGQHLGQGGGLEKAEGALGVELDVGQS